MKLTHRPLLAALLLTVLVPVSPIHAQQQSGASTNYETRLSAIEDEMRALNGQLEQLGYAIRRLDQNQQRMQGDYDARITKLEAGVSSMAADAATRAQTAQVQAQAQQQQPIGTIDGSLGALKTQTDGRVTGAIVAPQSPPLPTPPPQQTEVTPQEQYEHAFELMRQMQYDDAEKAFADFINENPKDKMIDNAKYWHAETLYVRGKFPEAATGFADSFQQNPQGNKAPDSLLKLAMSLSALNKVTDACVTLTELRAKYPNASTIVKTRANEQRTKLKCS